MVSWEVHTKEKKCFSFIKSKCFKVFERESRNIRTAKVDGASRFFFFSSESHSFYLLGKLPEAVAGICWKFNKALGKQCKILLGVTSAHFPNLEKKP